MIDGPQGEGFLNWRWYPGQRSLKVIEIGTLIVHLNVMPNEQGTVMLVRTRTKISSYNNTTVGCIPVYLAHVQ